IGGLAGAIALNGVTPTVANSFATGAIKVGDSAYGVGGLIGTSEAAQNTNYATGTITAGQNASLVGGLVGRATGTIASSYATGAVTTGASGNSVGGLAGYFDAST
ncbi:GLUG motif-containing protein, partial [Acinetobacter baumannii]